MISNLKHTQTHIDTYTQIPQRDPVDEAIFLHLPAVMGVIMRTWHLLDIKKHSTLSGMSPVLIFPNDLDDSP